MHATDDIGIGHGPGLTNDGVLARGEAQSRNDCLYTPRLCCMVHMLRQPEGAV